MAIETIKEFARRHGVSKQTVMNWKRAGYVVSTEGGHIDGEASDALLAQRAPTLPRRHDRRGIRSGQRQRPHEHGSMADALLRKEEALAELRELQLDRESGRVVLVEDAVRILAGTMALVRAHLLRLGAVDQHAGGVVRDAGGAESDDRRGGRRDDGGIVRLR